MVIQNSTAVESDTLPWAAGELSLRPICKRDQEFLYRLYASTRAEELHPIRWDEEQKGRFLRAQYQDQHRYFTRSFREAEFLLVVRGETPIGRLYLDRRGDAIRVIDLSLLPDHRGQGLGSALLVRVLEEGRARGQAVRLGVEKFNPALRLYQRLGFRPVEDTGIRLLMEWRPEPIQ